MRDASHARDAHGDGPSGRMRLEAEELRSQSGQGQDVAFVENGRVISLEISSLGCTLILGPGIV